jgi:hypothetical protein
LGVGGGIALEEAGDGGGAAGAVVTGVVAIEAAAGVPAPSGESAAALDDDVLAAGRASPHATIVARTAIEPGTISHATREHALIRSSA